MRDQVRVLTGGHAILPGRDHPEPATVVCRGDLIDEILDPVSTPPADARVLDVTGCLVAPGLVDLHGDAFERSVMPRSGVFLDLDLALADNDAQLLAAGITTSYLSATDSWEPGLRSRTMLNALIEALERRSASDGHPPRPDVRLHVRHERCNTSGHDELLGHLRRGRVELLSFNDHTLAGDEKPAADRPLNLSKTQLQRTGLDDRELADLLVQQAQQRDVGRQQERELAEVAIQTGRVIASHDPRTAADLDRDLGLGVGLAEFPMTVPLARRYRSAGLTVLLGAPNLVRGGSHLNNLSVADALAADAGDILCSDYHYPSLLHAPFVAADRGLLPLGRAWEQVAATPAATANLTDRGRLEPGLRADLVVVAGGLTSPARVAGTLVAGRPSGAWG
jgi:alpha-D-ribose 1-methylphosphonate 5-triphosphate diphosphatase